jgi:hypothetical protein
MNLGAKSNGWCCSLVAWRLKSDRIDCLLVVSGTCDFLFLFLFPTFFLSASYICFASLTAFDVRWWKSSNSGIGEVTWLTGIVIWTVILTNLMIFVEEVPVKPTVKI